MHGLSTGNLLLFLVLVLRALRNLNLLHITSASRYHTFSLHGRTIEHFALPRFLVRQILSPWSEQARSRNFKTKERREQNIGKLTAWLKSMYFISSERRLSQRHDKPRNVR